MSSFVLTSISKRLAVPVMAFALVAFSGSGACAAASLPANIAPIGSNNSALGSATLTTSSTTRAVDDAKAETSVSAVAGNSSWASGAKQEETNSFLLAASDQNTPHRTFSLRTCFDKADTENKEILVAASAMSISQAAIVIAKAIPNPTYSMTYGFGNSYTYIIAGNGQQFGWSEELLIAGRRTKRTELAKANYLQTALQLESVRFDIHNRTRRAYAELAAAHAYADVIDAQREIAKKLLDISQKRFDAGKAPGSEVLQAKLNFMQFDTQENQAWGRIVQDSAQMSFMLGETPHPREIIDVEKNGLFKLSDEKNDLIPDPNRGIPMLQQLLPVAWQRRNDLRAAIQQAYANKKALTLAKTQRIPDPTIGYQYFFSSYSPFQFGFFDPAGVLPFLQGIFPNDTLLTPRYHNPNPPPGFVIGLYNESIASGAAQSSGTAIPDINKDHIPYQGGHQAILQQEHPFFYQYQGEIAQAKATWMQQFKQNELLRAQIATDIVTSYESLLVARANLKKFQDQVLPAAARVSQMTFRGYELGKMDLATAMLAQQQYQQLLSSYFDAVVAYQNSWADMEKAVGVPLRL